MKKIQAVLVLAVVLGMAIAFAASHASVAAAVCTTSGC